MKKLLKLSLALSLALNGFPFVSNAAEPAKALAVAKPASATDDVNDGACGCDDDEDASPVVKVAEPTTPQKKKTAKVTTSTTTKVTTTHADGGSTKETTTAKYVNGELVSGSTTTTSGNADGTLARPITPVTPAAETK